MPEPLLTLAGVDAEHGAQRALSDVSFAIDEGRATVVLGNNGAGKSTLLSTIMGVLPGQPRRGRITFAGRRIDGMATEKIVRAGVSWVPEGRRVFPDLTVRENLTVGAWVRRGRAEERRALERVHAHFPLLAERRSQAGGTLSGGEQQMLAIGRALMNGPRLLLLDEPSLGLAPIVVRQVYEVVRRLRDEGVSMLIVEQNARAALTLGDHGLVLQNGRIVAAGAASELVDNPDVEALYMVAP